MQHAADSNDGGVGRTPVAIDQMMAPIALYPDSLLSQVLVARTC